MHNRHYHGKFCIDKFPILNWTNLVISRNYEFIIMNFVINISQYVKTKTHNNPFVITFNKSVLITCIKH